MEKNNIRITDDNENNFFENVDSDLFIEKTMPYMELMMKYGCALKEITTKFEVLNSEFSLFIQSESNRINQNKTEKDRAALWQSLQNTVYRSRCRISAKMFST